MHILRTEMDLAFGIGARKIEGKFSESCGSCEFTGGTLESPALAPGALGA